MALKLTRTESAEIICLSPRHFDEKIRPLIAKNSVSGEGKTLRFDAAAVVASYVDYRCKQVAAKAGPEAWAAIEEGVSPSLDRWRSAKADREEMQRDRERGLLIPRNELEEGLAKFAAMIRRAGEKLARDFSNDAAGVLNEAAVEAESGWQQMLAKLAQDKNQEANES